MPRSLLIVEDNPALRQMLSLEFEELGYRVIGVGCCDEARQMAYEEEFEFALLDYNLPDGVGTDLMSELRVLNPNIQIILCSGMASERKASDAICRGAFRFLAKPVLASSLHRLFDQALAQHSPC
jgi:two-component system response regulator AtoC